MTKLVETKCGSCERPVAELQTTTITIGFADDTLTSASQGVLQAAAWRAGAGACDECGTEVSSRETVVGSADILVVEYARGGTKPEAVSLDTITTLGKNGRKRQYHVRATMHHADDGHGGGHWWAVTYDAATGGVQHVLTDDYISTLEFSGYAVTDLLSTWRVAIYEADVSYAAWSTLRAA